MKGVSVNTHAIIQKYVVHIGLHTLWVVCECLFVCVGSDITLHFRFSASVAIRSAYPQAPNVLHLMNMQTAPWPIATHVGTPNSE